MADYTPVYVSGNTPFTKTASGTVTGGQVVIANGVSTVATATAAAATCVGLAAHDAATGTRVTVWPLANSEHEAVASGTITAGDGVVSAASGQVATATIATAAAAGTLLGVATTSATVGNKVRFLGRG